MPRRHPSTDRASAVSRRPAQRADTTLNDACQRGLREFSQVSPRGSCVRTCTARTRAAAAPRRVTSLQLRLAGGAGTTRRERRHVDLFEYQGRDLFERHGLPVLGGGVAETPQEARAIAERLGGRVVVKAQVKVGGRGKAGGVKLAEGADEAFDRASDILGMDIKGHTVHKVML